MRELDRAQPVQAAQPSPETIIDRLTPDVIEALRKLAKALGSPGTVEGRVDQCVEAVLIEMAADRLGAQPVPAAVQAEPAGYVTAIAEGKVLMLPRPSLNTDGMVPLYAAPSDALLRQAVEALEDVTQTLDWHCHGCCRGISDRLLPSDEAVKKGIAAIASLRSCIGRGG